MQRLILAIAAFTFLAPAQDAEQFRAAGVCSRCHVAQVLEWTTSKHVQAKTACRDCHGPSAGHVANERNQVKPDRLPRGSAEIAALCSTCHTAGCPKTSQKTACESCHHPHALLNPGQKKLSLMTFKDEERSKAFEAHLRAGDARVKQSDWKGALAEFESAVKLIPNSRQAKARRTMAWRRLNPEIPGFERMGEQFDPVTGLPLAVRVKGFEIEMILIRGGAVDIGSDRFAASKPVHSVSLEPFYLGKTELTQKQWSALGFSNPSQSTGDSMPVNNITWEEAVRWTGALSEKVPGGGFRLPNEAEWEAAAGGERPADMDASAWHRDNSGAADPKKPFREIDTYRPHPVAGKRASGTGLFDLHGNVWEWCSSLLLPYPYGAGDGREAKTGSGLRVLRGGGFADSASDFDPAFRHGERPSRRQPWNGMRLARSLPAID